MLGLWRCASLFALAMRAVISEALVRRYVRECGPSTDDCELLNSLDGSLRVRIEVRADLRKMWLLGELTKVRVEHANGDVIHYEGEQGAERIVRTEGADGSVVHYEGAQGTERMVRVSKGQANGICKCM